MMKKRGNARADENPPALSGIRQRRQVAIPGRFSGAAEGGPGARRDLGRGGGGAARPDKISFDTLDRGLERCAFRFDVGLRQRGIIDPKLIDQSLAGAIVERMPLFAGVRVKRPDRARNQRIIIRPSVSICVYSLRLQLSI